MESEDIPNNIRIAAEGLNLRIKTDCIKKNSTQKICWYYNKGFCKKKTDCSYRHEPGDCILHLEGKICGIKSCAFRHRNYCKSWKKETV